MKIGLVSLQRHPGGPAPPRPARGRAGAGAPGRGGPRRGRPGGRGVGGGLAGAALDYQREAAPLGSWDDFFLVEWRMRM